MKNQAKSNIPELVDDILKEAIGFGASDIHFEPTSTELQVKYRLDGTLKTVEVLPAAIRDNVISRLKVLGNLLTYRNDIPQEGRIEGIPGQPVDSES
ncbi:MAG: ATPase, T2SS/T4P/T4SS family, partial [Planctomycetota bacterium]